MMHMPRTRPFDEQYERYEEWFEKNRLAYHSELQALESDEETGKKARTIRVRCGC